ncbi:MAG: hypothetical protein LBC99_01950 [Spirochaetota bacterium]|jgi:hypothetical protein|nr:hypothetical protein [Spirochaetota bacterium]
MSDAMLKELARLASILPMFPPAFETRRHIEARICYLESVLIEKQSIENRVGKSFMKDHIVFAEGFPAKDILE